MKTTNRPLIVGLLALCSLLLAPCSLLAQASDVAAAAAVPAALGPVLPVEAQNFILELLGKLMISHPWVATLVAVLGSMRLWAKPVFSLVHTIIDATPSKYDDGIWAALYAFFTVNPVGKFLAYLLDWFASVKITPAAPVTPREPGV